MKTTITIQELKEKLIAGGYGGLYFAGECGCTIDDLAPCGCRNREDGEEFINGCEPGYRHIDPRDPTFFVISGNPIPPSPAGFDEIRVLCG